MDMAITVFYIVAFTCYGVFMMQTRRQRPLQAEHALAA